MIAGVRKVARGTALALALHTAVNARLLRRAPAKEQVREALAPERISVLLPVRNEAHRMGPCLKALQMQEIPAAYVEFLVLDDDSSDATRDVAAAASAADPRLRVLPGAGGPAAGFIGKPWACHQLAQAADPAASVLVFLDVDVVLAADGLARTVGLLRAAGLGFVSPYPRQRAGTAAERLIQPLLQWLWLAFAPLRLAERSRHPSLAMANGQLLAVDAARYRSTGGHAAPEVRGAVLEDIAIARLLRGQGCTGGMADGTDLAECRMYEGWPQLRAGYVKSLWSAAGGRWPASVAQLALLASLYVRRDPVCYAAGVASRIIAARRTGGSAGDAFAHPFSIVLLGYLTAQSWYARWTGRLRWKDRPVVAAGSS